MFRIIKTFHQLVADLLIRVAAVDAVVAGATYFLAPVIAQVYSRDPLVLDMLGAALALTALLFIVDGLQGVLMGALRGAADTLIPTIVYIVSFVVVGLPMGYLIGFKGGAGVPALIWSLIAALVVAVVVLWPSCRPRSSTATGAWPGRRSWAWNGGWTRRTRPSLPSRSCAVSWPRPGSVSRSSRSTGASCGPSRSPRKSFDQRRVHTRLAAAHAARANSTISAGVTEARIADARDA